MLCQQNGILHYCGFQVLEPQIFWAPPYVPHEMRTAMLEAWRARLPGLLEENPLPFTCLECFDGNFQLKPEVYDKHVAEEFGPAAGLHLGKRLPTHQKRLGV